MISELQIALRVLVSAVLGAIVGLERERSDQLCRFAHQYGPCDWCNLSYGAR